MKSILIATCISHFTKYVLGFGYSSNGNQSPSVRFHQQSSRLSAVNTPDVTIVHEHRMESAVNSNEEAFLNNQRNIFSSSFVSAWYGSGNPSLEKAFGQASDGKTSSTPLQNINTEGNAIDSFYGNQLANPWESSSNSGFSNQAAASLDYVKSNPELLKEYNIERNMLNLLPIVGIIWGVIYFTMNWINYEVNDQTYMSEEEERRVAIAQIPIVGGLLFFTYLAALFAS